MRDPAPLSQRFDLAYVRRRWWPWRWGLRLSLVLGIAAIAWAAVAVNTGDDRAFTSGAISEAHSFIAQDCSQCHQPDPARSGYWLTATDAACTTCHVAAAHPDPHARLYTGQTVAGITMSSDCAACHIEHQGVGHDLKRVGDHACVQCHRDLSAYVDRAASAATSRPDFHALGAAREVTP